MARLGCLVLLVPLVDFVLLFQVGRWIGPVPTLLLVGTTALVGALLARRAGVRALIGVRTELARGRPPARALLDGAALVVGGACLLLPGLLTDVFGLLLLLPPTRWALYGWLQLAVARAVSRGSVRVHVWGAGFPPPGGAQPPGGRGSTSSGPEELRDRRGSIGDAPGDPGGGDRRTRPPRPGEIIQD